MHNWTEKDVAGQFEDAVSTLRKLPPVRVQGYFNAWPEIIRTPEEIAACEPMPLRLRATPDAISRMDEALIWLSWVEALERKLIWGRAAKKPWRVICCEVGYSRAVAWKKWQAGLRKIVKRLNTA